jgi:hypothetical protein
MNGRQQERHKRNNIIYIEYGSHICKLQKMKMDFKGFVDIIVQ